MKFSETKNILIKQNKIKGNSFTELLYQLLSESCCGLTYCYFTCVLINIKLVIMFQTLPCLIILQVKCVHYLLGLLHFCTAWKPLVSHLHHFPEYSQECLAKIDNNNEAS